MNTEKLMKELETCKDEYEMKKVFENNFPQIFYLNFCFRRNELNCRITV